MKISKKLKWTLGLVGLTAISIIPMSIALTSCSDNGEFSSSFVDDMTNPNSSICVDQSKYDQILNINKNYKNLVNKEYTSNPIQVAQDWLSKATKDEIEELLFINFNRCDEITQDGMSGNDAWFTKKFCDVEVTNYNFESKVVNFKLKIYYNEYMYEQWIIDKNDEGNTFGIDFKDETYSYQQTYLEYEINNFKFVVHDINNEENYNINKTLPILSFDKLDNSTIKCVNSNVKFESNYNDIYKKIFNLIKNKLSDADKNSIENAINKNDQYQSTCEKDFENIPNLDWNNIMEETYPSHDYTSFPFMSSQYWDASIFDINMIGMHRYSSSEDNAIILNNYYNIPLFVISQFNDDSNIEIIQ